MAELKSPLVMRLFELGVKVSFEKAFKTIGIHNLTTSIKTEAGTLSMYVLHDPENPNHHIVLEIYADESAYQTHAASSQFAEFVQIAQQGLAYRRSYELEPQLLIEQEAPLYVEKGAHHAIALVEVDVATEQNEAFRHIVEKTMKDRLAKESGLLAVYAATLKDRPTSWRFLEIYADESAYISHCQSPRVKAYLDKTAQMVKHKTVLRLAGDTLVNQGGLYLE